MYPMQQAAVAAVQLSQYPQLHDSPDPHSEMQCSPAVLISGTS